MPNTTPCTKAIINQELESMKSEAIISVDQSSYMPTLKDVYYKLCKSLKKKKPILLQPYETVLLVNNVDVLDFMENLDEYLEYKSKLLATLPKDKFIQFENWCKLHERFVKSSIDLLSLNTEEKINKEILLLLKKGAEKIATYLADPIFNTVLISFKDSQKHVSLVFTKKDTTVEKDEDFESEFLGEMKLELKTIERHSILQRCESLSDRIIELYDSIANRSCISTSTNLTNLNKTFIDIAQSLNEATNTPINTVIVAKDLANTAEFKEVKNWYLSPIDTIVETDKLKNQLICLYAKPELHQAPLIIFVNAVLAKDNYTEYDYAFASTNSVYKISIKD